MDENSLSHTRWKCQYHIVFIPKYRRKVLYDNKEVVKCRSLVFCYTKTDCCLPFKTRPIIHGAATENVAAFSYIGGFILDEK